MENKKIVCWWSGGITSAVACKIAIDLYGKENCIVIMIDTKNEDEDTYRFKKDCEKWYNIKIDTITAIKSPTDYCANTKDTNYYGTDKYYDSILDVWERNNSLNVATGAICSTELKRVVRERWQRENTYDYQVFGFEFEKKEFNRGLSLKLNHPKAKSIYPLLMMGYDKKDCIRIVQEAGIRVPRMYELGFKNNNCFKTGCVQGGIGYWQKIQKEFPDKFDNMAEMEHKLTNKKGKPVTMLRVTKEGVKVPLFLKPHPKYSELPLFNEQKGRPVQPLFECNGFCGVNDLSERIDTEREINYD